MVAVLQVLVVPNQKKTVVREHQKFQIKAGGANVHPNPTLGFTLRSPNGLELGFNHDHGEPGETIPMLSLSDATGKWIQVRMQHSLSGFSLLGRDHGSEPILLIIMVLLM